MQKTPRRKKVAIPLTPGPLITMEDREELTKAAKQEVKELALRLVTDPYYLANLRIRLRNGALPPPVETLLWAYAFGKPKEQIEVKKITAVRIVHEFADSPKVGESVEIEVKEVPTIGEGSPVEVEHPTE